MTKEYYQKNKERIALKSKVRYERTKKLKGKKNLGSKTKELWKDPEYRKRMSEAHKGQVAWNKGLKIATNTGRTRFKKGENLNEAHPQWKGNNVGYISLHGWVRRHFGKASKCENPDCIYPRRDSAGKMMLKPKKYHWANKTGKYLRDINDWWMLCSSCHRKDKVRTPKDWLNRLM